jgi:phthiocerol/phenolphthiocerol synthesis type-I polyketide synthase E
LTGIEPRSIAIIGMAGRFPSSSDLDEYWKKIQGGEECISHFDSQTLIANGVSETELSKKNYVPVAPTLPRYDCFDASFFGMTSREAELTDPQQRIFLEICWAAMEDAGIRPTSSGLRVGVFGGTRTNTYIFNLLSHRELIDAVGTFHLGLFNDLSVLTSRVSHFMNFSGPSYSLHTACSTSLVALHLACESLLRGECRSALCGGVAINVPHICGYVYNEGSVQSPDGRCRTFDAEARGTVFGSGVGVVVLKRLEDALADGNTIHAVIRGTAVNNDGALKANFAAPSVQGQSSVVAEALSRAGLSPNAISYIECHGTGTIVGDAIEVRALSKVFTGLPVGSCGLGSVKTNIGHLDAAAGVAGLIKVVLSMKHRMLPPSLHFKVPNPQIRFEDTPFYVNTELRPWVDNRGPLRAGVSAFGVGGTNAHIILEEAPSLKSVPVASDTYQVLPLSAKTSTALARSMDRLVAFLKKQGQENLGDIAYTLQVGRQRFPYRFALTCSNREQAIEVLEQERETIERECRPQEDGPPSIVFMFPGQGAQHSNMGRDLYKEEPVFRKFMDQCSEILQPHLGLDLARFLYEIGGPQSYVEERLTETWLAQPSIFAVEYSLSQLWISWGITPTAILGHSLGEYVAACVSGVMSLEDALRIVAVRGKLMQQTPKGAMLSIALSLEDFEKISPVGVEVATLNAVDQITVAGDISAIEVLERLLDITGVAFVRLHTSHAFHCRLVESIVPEFMEAMKSIALKEPEVPFLSCVTGDWIENVAAKDPMYWVNQMRRPVRFLNAVNNAMDYINPVLLEVGPGQTLRRIALRQLRVDALKDYQGLQILPSLPASFDAAESNVILRSLGLLWEAGSEISWEQLHRVKRQYISLPTYPFESKRHWIDPRVSSESLHHDELALANRGAKTPNIDAWFWIPSWRLLRKPHRLISQQNKTCSWLIFADKKGLGNSLALLLTQKGDRVTLVNKGAFYAREAENIYTINPQSKDDYKKLFSLVPKDEKISLNLINLWLTDDYLDSSIAELEEKDFYKYSVDGLLALFQASLSQAAGSIGKIWILTSNCERIEASDICLPEYGGVSALCRVSLQEADNKFVCGQIDLRPADYFADSLLVGQLGAELCGEPDYLVLGYRGDRRWGKDYQRARLDVESHMLKGDKSKKTYLITGGLGSVGCLIGRHLARMGSRVVLIGRAPLPPRPVWTNVDPEVTNDTVKKIARVVEMENEGLDLHIMQADVTSVPQMALVIERCLARFGPLAGVIHAAGLTSGPSIFCPVANVTREVLDAQSEPKFGGLRTLAEVTKDIDIDFILAMSSNASILGGLGSGAYAMANAEMDSFANRMNVLDKRKHWMSINWDHWPEETKRLKQYRTSLDDYAMSEKESLDVIDRIIDHFQEGQMVVSSGDLSIRLQTWEHALLKAKVNVGSKTEGALSLRPSLRTLYQPPQNALQQQIERIWSEFLGVEKIGIMDDFFELGGHSLLATRIITKMREELNIEIPLVTLFEGPTISEMANVISGAEIIRTNQ